MPYYIDKQIDGKPDNKTYPLPLDEDRFSEDLLISEEFGCALLNEESWT